LKKNTARARRLENTTKREAPPLLKIRFPSLFLSFKLPYIYCSILPPPSEKTNAAAVIFPADYIDKMRLYLYNVMG
jgi:hypothetical protein